MSAEPMKITDRRTMTVLADEPQQAGVVATSPVDVLLNAIQRTPNMDLVKLEKLMELAERWQAAQERRAFVAAISAAKAKIKPILKRQKVDFTSQKGRTHYKHEAMSDIAEHVDPILSEYGLSYRYRPKQDGERLTIICVLSHRDGHEEEIQLTAKNDDSGNKNTIQSVGSTATYLQRYTLKLALGLSAAKDDDGRGAGSPPKPEEPAPEGYERWNADMTALAEEGSERLQAAWSQSSAEFRRFVVKHDEEWWVKTKRHAANMSVAASKGAQQ